MTTKWWHLGTEEVVRTLASDAKAGLSSAAADEKLRSVGPNELREKKGRGPLSIFVDQFRSIMIGVLVAAALISGFLKEWVDAVAILAIVILNAVLGLVQEYRAEKSLAALKRLSAPSSKVFRDGVIRIVPARELVPGDLVEVEAGDHVPADGRVVWHTSNFAVQEASLTGESTPVNKTDIALEEKDIPLAERANILYLGTSVVAGKARALIVETGMRTELGRIAGLIQGIKKETTPLQEKLEQFSKFLVYLCFFLVAIVFGLEVLRGASCSTCS
jgi:Ca2+-transporting ATPase